MQQINNDSFLRQLFKQTEEEKKRIANEIHEKINHELIELKKDFRVDIEDLSSRVDLIIRQIREIYSELHPVLFEDIGLKDSIEHLVATIQAKHDLFITTDIRYNQALTKDEDLQIFRIVQESLLNIVNYTKATAVRINIFVIKSKKYKIPNLKHVHKQMSYKLVFPFFSISNNNVA